MAGKASCYLLFLLFGAIVTKDVFICNEKRDAELKHCMNILELLAYTVHSNDTIKIEPGTYNLLKANTAYSLVIRDVVNVTLMGYTADILTMELVATLKCSTKLSFTFINVSNLRLSDLSFIGCGAPITMETAKEVLQVQTNSFYRIPNGVHAALLFANVYSLVIDRVNVSGSYGFGMLAINVLGETSISRATFRENNYYAQRTLRNVSKSNSKSIDLSDVCSEMYESATVCIGGNIMILFQEVMHCVEAMYLKISETFILSGIDVIGQDVQKLTENPMLHSSSGLGVVLGHVSYSVTVIVSETVFNGNAAPKGASLTMLVHETDAPFKLLILEVTIMNANCAAVSKVLGPIVKGSGILYKTGLIRPSPEQSLCPSITSKTRVFVVLESRLSNNGGSSVIELELELDNNEITIGYNNISGSFEGTALFIDIPFLFIWRPKLSDVYISSNNFSGNLKAVSMYFSRKSILRSVNILGCNFYLNGYHGSTSNVISLHSISMVVQLPAVYIEDTMFTRNSITAMSIARIAYVSLKDCSFVQNNGTAVKIIASRVLLSGKLYFSGNVGINGGAIALTYALLRQYFPRSDFPKINDDVISMPIAFSLAYLQEGVQVVCVNNSAKREGGALYIETPKSFHTHIPCPFQHINYASPQSTNTSVYLKDNKAVIAGDSIYGGMYNDCRIILPDDVEPRFNSSTMFNNLFTIATESWSLSEVSDDADYVCACNGSLQDCFTNFASITVFPGQTTYISIFASRYNNFYQQYGAAPAVVSMHVVPTDRGILKEGQDAQQLLRKCTNVTITPFTRHGQLSVDIFVQKSKEKQILLEVDPLKIDEFIYTVHLSIKKCPLGFVLDFSNFPGCVCAKMLHSFNCTCNIDSNTFICPLGYWVGVVSSNITVHRHCSYDYCSVTKAVHVDNLDKQCAYNRTGILCGRCKEGFSAIFGSSKCLHCSNVNLLILIPLALVGGGLIVILMVLDITVAVGTINGLIYFVNCIQVNSSIFLSPSVPAFLRLFVAWLNLDLGIETCFYNGMDTYARTWLQFVFPAYIWGVVIAVILLSRYSYRLSRLTRSNIVPVLATLFILSYTKLLRTVIAAISLTYLLYEDGTIHNVWMVDGNVAFFQGKHAILAVAAITFSVGFLVPYTLLLILTPCLQRQSHHFLLKWVNKLKPFLDANTGPFTLKFRGWNGLLLLIRAVQFLIFAVNSEGDPNVNLLVMLLFSGILIIIKTFGFVYQNKVVGFLETFYTSLLGALAATSLYIRTVVTRESMDRNQTIATVVFVGAALLVLLGIVCYHILLNCKVLYRKAVSRCAKRHHDSATRAAQYDVVETTGTQSRPSCTLPTITYVELSELIKEEDSSDDTEPIPSLHLN